MGVGGDVSESVREEVFCACAYVVYTFSSTTEVQLNSQGALMLGGVGVGERYSKHHHQAHRAKSTKVLEVERIGLLTYCPSEGAPASK